jgi:pyruvate,water dikinase
VKDVVPLAKARDDAIFGSKAVGLGEATREGLQLPPGIALSGSIVEAVAGGEQRAIGKVLKAVRPLERPLAVRSSAVDEDGAEASFAGQHLTLLNVATDEDVTSALREILGSANSD